MNDSLITADAATHLKILAVSLAAAILVLWIGICARAAPGGSESSQPRFEQAGFGVEALARETAQPDRRPCC